MSEPVGNTDYGVRLNGYSVINGKKLCRYDRSSDKEYKIGNIESTKTLEFGPVYMTVWTLTSGEKYHHISTQLFT